MPPEVIRYCGDYGFETSGERPLVHNGYLTYYHYTHENNLPSLVRQGLYAFRLIEANMFHCLHHRFRTEGFLSIWPEWWCENRYFGSLAKARVDGNIGRLLLRIDIPVHSFEIYIADFVHILELREFQRSGKVTLNLGYDLSNEVDAKQGFYSSYIPVNDYAGQHIAPVVQVILDPPKRYIEPQYVQVSHDQPRLK